MNALVTKSPKRVFEICDLDICPAFVSSACQSVLTAVWITRVPFISIDSPANIAASILLDQFSLLVPHSTQIVDHKGLSTEQNTDELEDVDTVVVDFCSGAGGPVPTLEKIVNASRKTKGMGSIKFFMTDLRPNVPAWSVARIKSEGGNLCYIADKVDATDSKLDSILSPQQREYEDLREENDHDKHTQRRTGRKSRVFRTFHLSFHHFDNSIAKRVLKSALEGSDGFAILELQDRRLCSVISVVGLVGMFTVLFSGILLWGGLNQIFFTLALPIIPLVMTWDGFVSCLRVREFRELMELLDDVYPGKVAVNDKGHTVGVNGKAGKEGDLESSEIRRGDWVFKGGRKKFLIFGGDVTWFVGRRIYP